MIFRYYISNMMAGKVEGTNDDETAIDLSRSEDFFVVDSETGEWLTADGARLSIEEAP